MNEFVPITGCGHVKDGSFDQMAMCPQPLLFIDGWGVAVLLVRAYEVGAGEILVLEFLN